MRAAVLVILVLSGCASAPYVSPYIAYETGQRVCGATGGGKVVIWGCK